MKNLLVSISAILVMTAGAHAAGEPDAAAGKATAKAMVEEAVSYLASQGRDKALAEVGKPRGMFDKGEIYVFAYDMQGVIVAHPKNPKLVGKNLVDVPDNDGKLFRKEIVQVARTAGSGWVDYKYLNPETKKPEAKTTYVKKAGDLVLCAGTYK
jgi:signal transduction histidine kinase